MPRPLPQHLRPRLVPAGDDEIVVGNDLRFVCSLAEIVVVQAALTSLDLLHAQVLLTHREGSPWIEIDAVRVPYSADEPWPASWGDAPIRLALWRYTLDVYRVGDDGAVGDDPIYTLNKEEGMDDGATS